MAKFGKSLKVDWFVSSHEDSEISQICKDYIEYHFLSEVIEKINEGFICGESFISYDDKTYIVNWSLDRSKKLKKILDND